MATCTLIDILFSFTKQNITETMLKLSGLPKSMRMFIFTNLHHRGIHELPNLVYKNFHAFQSAVLKKYFKKCQMKPLLFDGFSQVKK